MSSIIRRTFIILVTLAGLYSLYGIAHFKWMYHGVVSPAAKFQIRDNPDANITMVEFLNYTCGYCKEMHSLIKETLTIRKDVRHIARPISVGEGASEKLPRIVIAAGLQGKFWEFHSAFLEYPEEEIPDDFIKETAELYGVDYKKLIEDSESKKVKKYLENNLKSMTNAGLAYIPSLMIGKRYYEAIEEKMPELKDILSIISEAEKSK